MYLALSSYVIIVDEKNVHLVFFISLYTIAGWSIEILSIPLFSAKFSRRASGKVLEYLIKCGF